MTTRPPAELLSEFLSDVVAGGMRSSVDDCGMDYEWRVFRARGPAGKLEYLEWRGSALSLTTQLRSGELGRRVHPG